MNKSNINYLGIIGCAFLYAITSFACAFLGFLSPWCWIVVFPVLAAVLGAPWTDSALKKWAGIERCQPFSNTRGL